LAHKWQRFALLILAGLSSVAFSGVALANFVISTITDPQFPVERETLEAATNYFSSSPILHARLATRLLEDRVSENQSYEDVVAQAEHHAARAAALAPNHYENHVLLAVVKEMRGDLSGSESAIRNALALSPHHAQLHWRLGNLLLRREQPQQALDKLRVAVKADASYLPEALSLIGQATDNQVDMLAALCARPEDKLNLALYLAQQDKLDAAAEIYSQLDAQTLLPLPKAGEFLDLLLRAGKTDLAHTLWLKLFDGAGKSGQGRLWNGGFETQPLSDFAQFDWRIEASSYARIGIADDEAQVGQHSLKIVFAGKNTTRLEKEISHLAVAPAGAKYQLAFAVKTDSFKSPDELKIVLTRFDTGAPNASSASVPQGTNNWQLQTTSFIVPAGVNAVFVSIRQAPKFSYTEPTTGTVWFDNLQLTDQ
jgi:Tfp pilus assembly protein PilF